MTLPRTGETPELSGSRRWNVYEGVAKISEVEFYERVGRDDLATRTKRRKGRGTTSLVAGSLLMAVGIGVIALGFNPSEDTAGTLQPPNGLLIGGGSALVLGGLGATTYGGAQLIGRSVSAKLAGALADDYNAEVLRGLAGPRPEDVIRDTAP